MTTPRRTLTVMEGREENSAIVKDLAAAAKRRGWDFHQLTGINSDRIARYDFDGIPLDYVIFRELSKNNYHEAERVMYWLKANHKICINADVAGRRMSTSDKHFQQGLFLLDPFLRQHALPTFEAKRKQNVLAYIAGHRIHYPFLLKDRRGTAGDNITLINSSSDLDQIQDFSNLLIEQYVKPECDYRVFVIGGAAVGIIRKTGNLQDFGDFVSWSGGRHKSLEKNPILLDRLSEIATRAAAISKLEYAGVDILKKAGSDELYLLETNIAAGWQNLTGFVPIDVPSLLLDWFEDTADNRKLPFATAVTNYLNTRYRYLPPRIQIDCAKILHGEPGATTPYHNIFANYPQDYFYDAGRIFTTLAAAFQDVATHPNHATKYANLINEIEATPLSWAGSFIGPEVGTFHDGAILSSLYLFLLHKIQKM